VPGVEVVTFETTQQAFLALQQGKGVGYVNDEASLVNDYAKLGPAKKEYAILPQSISVEPLALGLKKGEPALKTLVDGVLRELESSGSAEKLFFKWYGPATRLQFDKRDFKIDSDQV
jgi:polar amino acid transport system substrate-binding protein